jgi:hypothetical protein
LSRQSPLDELHYYSGMSDDTPAEVFDQLRRVITWEVDAQVSVERRIEDIPAHIADTLLDYFDITLKPGANLSKLGD